MRKSFTRLFGFLLLNVMMLFSFGLYAQVFEQQSTVELKAATVGTCYNATNSYTAAISTKDFVKIKSFDITLKYDQTEFGVTTVTNVNALLGGTLTSTVDPVTGKIRVQWSNATEVTIGDNDYANLFDVKFNVLNFPNNSGDNLFDSTLDWDVAASKFWYSSDLGATPQSKVETTNFYNGSLNVPVSYSAIQYTVTSATCDGGQAIITITSPVGPGLYYYFNGSTTSSTTPVATANAPSTNTVRIVDANGCYSHSFSIPVTAPTPLVINSVTTENAKCNGGNGEIQIDATGGTGPYTYWVVPNSEWSFFVNTYIYNGGKDTPLFDKYKYTNFQILKPAGSYHVTVDGSSGCNNLNDGWFGQPYANPAWQWVTITEPAAITLANPTVTNILCNGSATGSILVDGTTISGGTATYTVSINNINWFVVGTTTTPTYTFTGLTAGTRTVTIMDANGCTAVKTATITQPDAMAFALAYQDATCAGGATGSVTVSNITGGTAPYTLEVQQFGTATWTTSTAGAGPLTVTGLAANYYRVQVRDANNCVKTFSNQDGSGNVLPIQAPGQLAFTTNTVAGTEVACNGGSFTLTITATGGVAPYVYSFDGGTTTTTSASKLYSGLVTDTTVSLVVTDKNGCPKNLDVTINVPTVLTADLNILANDEGPIYYFPPTCPGGNDGRISVLAQGGSAPYMYSTDNVIWYSNPVLAVPEGTTTVTVRDSKGCTMDKVVFVPSLTASTLTATVTSINCYGDQTGEIDVVTTWQADRTVKYYVSQTESAVFTTGTSFNPTLINLVANTNTKTTFVAGTYYLGARDEFGCMSNVVRVVITQKPALAMTAAVTNATCSGLFDGTLTINTTGGFGQPMYAYANNIEALSSSTLLFSSVDTWSATTSIGRQIVQVQRGTYYVKLKDGCSGNTLTAGPFIVDGYKPITFTGTVGKTNITCNGANNGTITVPLSGVKGGKPEFDGAGNYIFTLIKPVGGTVTNTTGVFTGLAGGTYTVTVKDASSCSSVSTIPSITIVNPTAVVLTATNVTHFTCKDSRNGQIAVSATGGTPGFWLAVNAVTPGTPITADNANWISFGSSTNTTQTKTYIATEPGVYYLYVKDANGCIGNTVSVTVLEPAVLTPVAVVTNATCNGGNGSVQLSVTGGWGATFSPTDYVFTVGTATNTSGAFTKAAGTYTASVKVNSGGSMTNGIYTYPQVTCSYSVPFTITQPVPYSYTAFTEPVKCKGDANGSFTVNVLGGSAATTTTTGDEYYVQLTTTAAPTLINGSAWKLTTNKAYKFTGLAHAHYTVWISNTNDGTGCLIPAGTQTPTDGVFTKANSWEVTEPALALTASVTFDNNVTCYGGSNGKFHVTAVGGTEGYKYAAKISQLPAHILLASELVASDWQDSNVFDHATVGTWIIWVKDANGCIVGGEGNGTPVDEWRVQITQPNQVTFTAAITSAVTCFGANNAKLTLTPSVTAGQPYTYLLTGVDYAGNAVSISGTSTSTNPVISNIPANKTNGSTATNTYSVTLTDKNGCSRTISAPQIVQNRVLAVDIVKADGAFVCPGDNNGTIEAVATGGSGTYAYRLWRDGAAYTSWVTLPSFLVQVGHTWAVEVSDNQSTPDNGCKATDQEIINAPIGVTATISETTCYSDASASIIIKATGEAGRTLSVRYRLNTGTYPATWTALNANGELPISGLLFSNVNVGQNFYFFEIKDDKGCKTELTNRSFVPTQHPLEVSIPVVSDLNASMTISGGISPYSYKVGSGAVVTMTVDNNTVQVVNLPAGQNTITVMDAHGCSVPAVVTVAPISVVAVPASGANQANTFNVTLTFNRDVTGVASSTTISGTGTPTVAIAGSGKTYTATITGADMATVTLALSNGIKDAAGNTLSATTFEYTIGDHVVPTVIVADPAVPVAKVFTVGLTFSEPVSGVASGVTVTGGTAVVTGSGASYSLTVTAPEQTLVTIVLTNAIADLSANANKLVPVTKVYTTGDFTAPTATYSPNGTTAADNHPKLVITFSENIVVGTGNVTIRKKSDGTAAIAAIPASALTISGNTATVTYAGGLDKNTDYYVTIDAGVVKDLANNAFAGVTATSTWTFKTGANFATGIDPINTLEFKVYPNPFVDYVNIDNASELSKVVVSNIAGQVVKEVVNPESTIQLNQLVSGVYFISLYQDGVVVKTVKIVKR